MGATLEEIRTYFVEDFHQCDHVVESIGPGIATIRQTFGEQEPCLPLRKPTYTKRLSVRRRPATKELEIRHSERSVAE